MSEGSAANLVYFKHEKYFTPAAPAPYRGDGGGPVRGLRLRALSLEAVSTTLALLQNADGVWLANALMSLMPVTASGARKINPGKLSLRMKPRSGTIMREGIYGGTETAGSVQPLPFGKRISVKFL